MKPDLSNINNEFDELILTESRLSKEKIIRLLFDDIYRAREAGVPYKVIVDYLNKKGISIHISYLRTIIREIKIEKNLISPKK